MPLPKGKVNKPVVEPDSKAENTKAAAAAKAEEVARAKAAQVKADQEAEAEAEAKATVEAEAESLTEAQAEEYAEAEAEAEAEDADGSDIPFDADEEFEEPAPEPEPRREVAVPASGGLTASESGSNSQVVHALQEEGFEGLTTGFGTFPQVVLQNEGTFQSSEGWEMGKEFQCVVMGSRQKFIIKNTRCETRDEDFVYTYDKVTNANTGEPVEATIKDWAERGWGYEMKPYLEVSAQLVDGDHAEELVLLSIPKTSIGRFSGYVIRLQMKGRRPSDVVTRVYRGDKVEKVDYPFYPWAFAEVK